MAMNGTILLVEDSHSTRLLLGFQLRKAGYDVLEAENGALALELCARGSRPDLIISDVMMPEMDGLEFCRQVRLQNGMERTPFIFLTTRLQDRHRTEAIEAGGTDYVLKPVNAPELLEKIRGYLAVVS